MSETGIYAGSYQHVRNYARSVDRLLLDLNSGTSPTEEAVAPVVSLLEAMQDEKTAAPSIQLLEIRWKQRASIPASRLAEIVSELRTQQISPRTLDDLEDLASLLDQERADMRLKLRGV
ncbi:MAG TPA: hypothetical protein VL171_11645 [Verrucomicrobiae bacterium]|nr:hypothetical protein [Verrucomicrobiae bacterium]